MQGYASLGPIATQIMFFSPPGGGGAGSMVYAIQIPATLGPVEENLPSFTVESLACPPVGSMSCTFIDTRYIFAMFFRVAVSFFLPFNLSPRG